MISILFIVLFVLFGVGAYQARKKLPPGLSWEGEQYPACHCEFLRDLTWVDAHGKSHSDQQIMDAVFGMIRGARKLILMDMFLINDFAGAVTDGMRPLALEVTTALLARKDELPGLRIVLITDPVNTVYGGLANPYLERLRSAGVTVVCTDLDRLRDSNLLYSPFWRVLLRPFGCGQGILLPNPFGAGRVSLRSYLRLLNFKANHRKLIVTDHGERYSALVTSANPHDASSAHGNVALRFSGPAVRELVACEESVPGVAQDLLAAWRNNESGRCPESTVTIQVLTESRVKEAVLRELRNAGEGDRVDLVMFYLSDRRIIRALIQARQRGAGMRILLDPNKDSFGRVRNGIPNRQTAAALVMAGVEVRWGNTQGEQLHSKLLLLERADGTGFLLLGSANFTRRNLDDYNLELDAAARGPSQDKLFVEAGRYVDQLWSNHGQKICSLEYSRYADHSLPRRILSRWQEVSGMSTF
ncbi:MAG TPA: phospholipase [Desulfobulbaceae bacterium]|nr:phospholipase [Desulfobulbaceae bacterium]